MIVYGNIMQCKLSSQFGDFSGGHGFLHIAVNDWGKDIFPPIL